MYLLYFLICFVLILLNPVNTYVLLAANIDDFRSLAKKFVPLEMADRIVDMATESSFKYRDIPKQIDTLEYEDSQNYQSFEVTTQPYKVDQPVLRQQNLHEMKRSAALLTIDEIVEKVKERLESDLLSKSRPTNTRPSGKFEYVPVNMEEEELPYEEPVYEDERPQQPKLMQHQGPLIKPQRPAMKKKRIVDRNKNVQTQSRYIDETILEKDAYQNREQDIDTQPFYYGNHNEDISQARPKSLPAVKQKTNKLKRVVPVKNKQPAYEQSRQTEEPSTTEHKDIEVNEGGIFEAVDMIKSNDSYEDYVTPARDDVFASDVEETLFTPGIVTIRHHKPVNRAPTEPTPAIEEAQVLQIEVKGPSTDAEYYDESTEGTTIEIKAKTESLSSEEPETTPDLNTVTTTEGSARLNKKKITVNKLGTQIPKREFYKISSPNYYGRLPTVAEKYNFDEPIPDKDREPENLKPIPKPPSSINGKVLLI